MRENKRAGARKVMIEKRKEDAERQLAMRERKEEEDRLLQARLAEATEEERRRQERCVCSRHHSSCPGSPIFRVYRSGLPARLADAAKEEPCHQEKGGLQYVSVPTAWCESCLATNLCA